MCVMADVLALAQDIWDLAREDPQYAAQLKTDYATLVKAIVSGAAAGDVISGSKNGASYTMRPGYSVQDRHAAIKWAVSGINTGFRPSRNRVTRFL